MTSPSIDKQQQKPGLVQRTVKDQLSKASKLAKDDITTISGVTGEALSSGAYLYPLYGIAYFGRNPKLLEGVAPIVYKSALWSGAITLGMFIFTYLPQVGVLAFLSGPLAFIAAIPVVLVESYVVSLFFLRSFLLPGATEKIFDAVLVQKGYGDLVERGRTLKFGRGGGTVLGASLLKPVTSKFSTEGLVRYLVTLPLNFIPGVGTAIFLFLNGQSAGPHHHDRYFQLKRMDKAAKQQFIKERRGAYTSLGAASVALSLVPIVGTLFSFTSAVGAALFAADLEKKERRGRNGGDSTEAGGQDKVEVGMGNKDEL